MIKEYQRYVRYLLSLWYVQNGKHELHAGYQCSFGADQKGFFPPLSFQILTLCSVLVDFLVYYHFF